MGSQRLLYGDPGQLRPYSHVQLLAAKCPTNVSLTADHVGWPVEQAFQYNKVDMTSAGPHVHWHASHRFCTTSTLQFLLYRTRCRASVLVKQYRMNIPLATVMRALFTRGPLGFYHSPIPLLPDPALHNPIRIVDLDPDRCLEQLEESLSK